MGSTTGPLVYVGTYTRPMPFVEGKAQGIYVCRMDPATGALTPVHIIPNVANPSFLALSPDSRALYAVDELDHGEVSAFAVDPATGGLTLLNRLPSHGGAPAHISVDRTGRWVFVANYATGNLAVFPIRDDRSLGPAGQVVQHHGHSVNPERQAGPHAHWVTPDPTNRFVLSADLGTDRVYVYRLDAGAGRLTPNDPPWLEMPPATGPRRIAFHPNGRYAYIVGEIANTLTACEYDGTQGTLRVVQALSTLPAGFAGKNTAAAVQVSPDGRFVYASNRGDDSLVAFGVDRQTGQLTWLQHISTQGHMPRDFNVDPTGTFLLAANQDTDDVVTFRVEHATGRLVPAGPAAHILTPVCLQFAAAPSAG